MVRRFGKNWGMNLEFKPQWFPERLPDLVTVKGVVFVNSMGDLFGNWVSDKLLDETFTAMLSNPHKPSFMMLTKNPARYHDLVKRYPVLPGNFWLGATLDVGYETNAPPVEERVKAINGLGYPRKWFSIEPYDPDQFMFYWGMAQHIDVQWVVIGVRTNPIMRLDDGEFHDLHELITTFQDRSVKVFVKNSIVGQWNAGWPREFPENVRLATKKAEWKPKVKKSRKR